jgi:hypothetical protein
VRHLDGHGPVELVVVGQIDAAEPSLAQNAHDPVAPDFRWNRLGWGFSPDRMTRPILDGVFRLTHALAVCMGRCRLSLLDWRPG